MLVYGALLSPYVRKVCLAAHEKGVAYELRLAGNGHGPQEFFDASPFGKIPAIRDGDFTLSDSSAILAWMDVKYPQVPLYPADAEGRGRAVWFEEVADTVIGIPGLKVLFNRLVGPKLLKVGGDEALAAQGEAELPRGWDYLERAVPDEGWLAGAFSIADHAVAAMIASLAQVKVDPAAERYPRIAAWLARVHARPAWQAVAEEAAARRR
jgi:glutathione S-transferase